VNTIDLGQTIQVLANVAVVAGIAVLVFQVRQNNQFLVADQATLRAEELSRSYRSHRNPTSAYAPKAAAQVQALPVDGFSNLAAEGIGD